MACSSLLTCSKPARNVSAVTAAQDSDPGFWPSVTAALPHPPTDSSNSTSTSSSRRRVLLVEPSIPPVPAPPPLPPPRDTSSSSSSSSDQSAAALQAWLLTHGADTTRYIAASSSVTSTSSSGSSSSTLSIVAESPGAGKTSSSGNSSFSMTQGSGLVLVVTTQELLYTLAIAGLLMVALTLLRSGEHLIVAHVIMKPLVATFPMCQGDCFPKNVPTLPFLKFSTPKPQKPLHPRHVSAAVYICHSKVLNKRYCQLCQVYYMHRSSMHVARFSVCCYTCTLHVIYIFSFKEC